MQRSFQLESKHLLTLAEGLRAPGWGSLGAGCAGFRGDGGIDEKKPDRAVR